MQRGQSARAICFSAQNRATGSENWGEGPMACPGAIFIPLVASTSGTLIEDFKCLKAAGYIDWTEETPAPGSWGSHAPFLKISRTSKLTDALTKDWKKLDENMVYIPVTDRELVEVTGIKSVPMTDKVRKVQFTYRYMPTKYWNEMPCLCGGLGLCGKLDQPIQAEAKFNLYDDGWRLQGITFH